MNTHDSSPVSGSVAGRVGPRKDTPPPHRGSPVLSHPATVPPQMPLRGPESHSERFLDVSQYETLGTHLEAVYGPYSTSAPSTRHSTIEARQDTKHHGVRTSPLARVVGAMGVAILTALTRQKSHRAEPNFETKEIGCYRVRGGGRGCDPARPYGGVAIFEHCGVVNEPCSGPVGPLLRTSFL